MSVLNDLTPSQREAVEHFQGPLLVLAGPGSGKTRVITRRITRLVERGVTPQEILAITFTNKAAGEMEQRVADLLPGCRIWIGTFHRFCSRLLRQYAPAVGLKSNFSIFDTTDQKQLLRQVLQELDIDAVHYPTAKIANRISRAKNDLQDAESFARRFEESIGDHFQAVVARVYPEYQKWLLKSNAVDFDDLLLHVVTLLHENPELRARLDEKFRYILVDEYQDTNLAQYRIVAALSQDHPNLCVTGDPDQSIYGWRGAKIDNILRFESEFQNAQVVRLEQNFRSTGQILQTADSLISNNLHRKLKALITDNPQGTPVELLCFRDGKHEADAIARQIRQLFETEGRSWSDFAVFYRVNALSREIELALNRHEIPYQVAGGVAFFQRAEIKDLLAYLKLVENPADRSAYLRIVNRPARGIGRVTQSKLTSWADTEGLSLLEATGRAQEIPNLSKRAVRALSAFSKMIDDFSFTDAGSVAALLEKIVEKTGYIRGWQVNPSEEDAQRLSNVEELLTAARQYDRMFEDDPSLQGFLEMTGLASEVDSVDESSGKVTLMTLHAAKGLEFPVVFILGVEQNLIPHERSMREGELRELEEERRLLFVGMTRAEQQLYLTQTSVRDFRGRKLHTIPSDFLAEMELLVRDDSFLGGEPETAPTGWLPEPSQFPEQNPLPDNTSSSAQDRPLLTTAANLLNGTKQPAEIPQGFSMGMKVRHPRYGLGTVVQTSGFGKRRTVTVEFPDAERRETFVTTKCPLQPAGSG